MKPGQKQYDPNSFAMAITAAISKESKRATCFGITMPEAYVIVSHAAIAPGIGFIAAALGKISPSLEMIEQICAKIIMLVDELPQAEEASSIESEVPVKDKA